MIKQVISMKYAFLIYFIISLSSCVSIKVEKFNAIKADELLSNDKNQKTNNAEIIVKIISERQEYKLGEEICLTIVFENKGRNDYLICKPTPPEDWGHSVLKINGPDGLNKVKYIKYIGVIITSAIQLIEVKANGSIKEESCFTNKDWDLNKPGTYEFQLINDCGKKQEGDDRLIWEEKIESNVIKIKIL